MTQLASATSHVNQFPALSRSISPAGAPWLDELRQAAAGRFHATGFPDPKAEDWRFTNLTAITRTAFEAAQLSSKAEELAASYRFDKKAVAAELVFVNGFYRPALSTLGKLPKGVVVMSLAEAIKSNAGAGGAIEKNLGRVVDLEADPFVALNTGHLQDGAVVLLPTGTTVEGVIHVLFVSVGSAQASAVHPRVLIVAGDNVEAAVVESYVGERDAAGVVFTNSVTEIVAGADCRIDHNKLQMESLSTLHLGSMAVKLGRSTQLVSHSTTLGGKLTRNDLRVFLAGQYADATLNGLVILQGEQHCDNHTLLHHQQPDCPSHELYKHVLDGKSTAVFKGKIHVDQIAQKTDSKQTSKTLLLTDDAQINSMPALEIYADDVKCTHGSTIGPVDEDMVFYLRSRGVSLDAARHLLTYAFAADVSRRIKVEPVRAAIETFMANQHGLPQDLRINDLAQHDEAVTN